jgi:hypothetical protein
MRPVGGAHVVLGRARGADTAARMPTNTHAQREASTQTSPSRSHRYAPAACERHAHRNTGQSKSADARRPRCGYFYKFHSAAYRLRFGRRGVSPRCFIFGLYLLIAWTPALFTFTARSAHTVTRRIGLAADMLGSRFDSHPSHFLD